MTKHEKAGETILIPVDSSRNSRRAFDWYIKHLWNKDDVLIFFHISYAYRMPKVSPMSPANLSYEEWHKIMQKRFEKIKKIENIYSNLATKKKVNFVFYHETTSANVGESICQYVKENKVHHIIIGPRGVGKFRRTFVGSTSDYVLHHSGLPVTIVPKSDQSEDDKRSSLRSESKKDSDLEEIKDDEVQSVEIKAAEINET